MKDAIEILELLIEKYGGELIKIENDNVKVQFASPEASAAFCKEFHNLQSNTCH